MRRLLSTMGLLAIMVFSLCLSSQASLNQFIGTWANVDPNSQGITRVEIRQVGAALALQAWGKASPSDIDWGTVEATAYGPNVSASQASAEAVTAIYNAGFKTSILVIHPTGARLSIETLTQFNDQSGRGSYHDTQSFERALAQPVIAPRQIQPMNNSVFDRYPRTTTLSWQGVPGAASYTVEIDYYATSWMSDRGSTYIVAQNLPSPTYTFNFIGAQPGRWRVWGVGANGVQGPKSPWWVFTYTR